MKINIVAGNTVLTSAINLYVKKKLGSLEKLMDKSTDKEALARVEIGKETTHHQKGTIFIAETHLLYQKKKYTAKVKGSDLYAAIDEMKDELMRELVSAKDKQTTRVKAGARKIKELLHAGA